MIKRYCDRCGQQIDEGVHAWYVLELHGTDGEFRHKELCEECYEYLCEKDEAPKADRKTENSSEIPNNCETELPNEDCGFNGCDTFGCPSNYCRGIEDEPHLVKSPQKSRDNHEIAKTEPQTDCAWK